MEEETDRKSHPVLERLRTFDAYPKSVDEFRVRTRAGGALTLICAFAAIIFSISELSTFLTIEVDPQVSVTPVTDSRIMILFEVTFPKLPCAYLEVDNLDVTGEQQLGLKGDIEMTRLTPRGDMVLGEQTIQKTIDIHRKSGSSAGEKPESDACPSCYGAESEERPCRKTCKDVEDAYRAKKWTFRPNGVKQCLQETQTKDMAFQLAAGEGCRIAGHVHANAVAGNLHIAPGISHQNGVFAHTHDIRMLPLDINMTHTIDVLAFGDPFPGVQNPLEGHFERDEQGAAMVQYFVKVVPTTYHDIWGYVTRTNQYSVTQHTHRVVLDGGKNGEVGQNGVPGVFILYDMSPIAVSYTEHRRSFMHLLTGLFAAIGGVVTTARFFDSFFYRLFPSKKN